MFRAIRGVKDILPQEARLWQEIEEAARGIFSIYNYQEIRTPLIEESALFNRSLGLTSEVVQKQMFEIKKDAQTLCLRPEATASVVRAYIEHNLAQTRQLRKFYYIGPMFRAERPQKGRLRQFHHIGVEAIGCVNWQLDVEVISLASCLLKQFAVSGFRIILNNLGCPKDKNALGQTLKERLKGKLSRLCKDCQHRYARNVFRILDCKKQACVEAVKGLNLGNDNLCSDCRRHFSRVKNGLDSLGVDYELSAQLVRGLDYYTSTVFEIVHADLGSQDAIGAGGRYDQLIEELGGIPAGAVGFALGLERVILAREAKQGDKRTDLVYLITLGEQAHQPGLKLLDTLRKNKIKADANYAWHSLKSAMRQANDLGARFVLIIGENELNKGVVTLKDMVSGRQSQIESSRLITTLKREC